MLTLLNRRYFKFYNVRSSTLFGVVILVFSPIDIIDLSFGLIGFNLIPFHLLAIAHTLNVLTKRPSLTNYDKKFVASNFFPNQISMIVLSFLIVLSYLLRDADPANVAFGRTLIVIALIFFSLLFVHSHQDDFYEIFLLSSKAYILLNLVVFFVQLLMAIGIIPVIDILASSVDLDGTIRLNGVVRDSSRAGVNLMIFLVLSFIIQKKTLPLRDRGRMSLPPWIYAAGIALTIATFSRNALVIFPIFLMIVYALEDSKQKIKLIILASSILFSLLLVVISSDMLVQQLVFILASSDGKENSTLVHFKLIEDATNILFSSTKSFLVGKGWGTEYLYAYEYFHGDGQKFANFHSGFISAGVQSGFLAAFLHFFIMVKPLIWRYRWGTLMIVILWSNIFYQYYIQPFYWIILVAVNTPSIQSVQDS